MRYWCGKGKSKNILLVIFLFLAIATFLNIPQKVAAQEKPDEGRLAAPPSTIEYVDLNNWTWVGPGDGVWSIEPGGRTVSQSVNTAFPAMYMSDIDMINKVVICEFEVTDTGDDDYVGFMLGMQNPTDRVSNLYEFILFDWKKNTQNVANEGFSLVRVNGTFNSGDIDPYFWNHPDTGPGANPEFDILKTNYSTSNGWQSNQRYEVRILYTPNRVRIVIDGNTVIDQAGTFQNGKLGFYCYSQKDVYFRTVKHAPGSDVEQPPVATDDNYFASVNTPISKDRFDGVLSNDYDYNLDSFTITLDTDVSDGNLTLNSDGSFSYTPDTGFVGIDTFTYHVTDDDGDSNIATGSIVVMAANEAPTDIQISNQAVPSSPVNGQEIATFTTTDPNIGDVHDYLLINNAEGRFGVSGDKLVVANASAISSVGIYSITVRTKDIGGLYYDEVIAIYGGDTATLIINTNPGTGQWRQTGATSWNSSGDSITILAGIENTVEFNDVAGFDTPSNRTYNVAADETETDTAVYAPHLGNLQVSTTPTSGQWRISGSSNWSNSGDIILNIPVGIVQIQFNDIANYDTPANQNIAINKNLTSTASGVYTRHLGSVRVTTNPATGKWRITGSSTWQDSGVTVSGVGAGNVEIEFQALADYHTPANQTLSVTKETIATATGVYVYHTGSLTLTTDPADGKWRIVGETEWNNSGATLNDLPIGNVEIEFLSTRSHNAPANRTFLIQTNTTTRGGIAYTIKIYRVKVNAAALGHTSHDGITDVEWGSSLSISAYPDANSRFIRWLGIDVPVAQRRSSTLNVGEISKNMEFTPVFQENLASIKVNIDGPPTAAWRIIGVTSWMKGGLVKGDLVPGNYTVEYQYVKGWVEPASFNVELANGSQITRSGIYKNVQKEYPPRIHYFTSTVEYISVGSKIRLEWFIQGGKAKSISNIGEVSGNVNFIDVRVDETTEFELTASNDNGITKAKTTVVVIEKPEIKYFVTSYTEDKPLHCGEQAELSWFVKGADNIEIVGYGSDISGDQVASGACIVRPEKTTTYKLIASNSSSRSEAIVEVFVTDLPDIKSFTSSHNRLPDGTSAKLQWKVEGADITTISPDIGDVKASGSVKVKPEESTTYVLKAENEAGEKRGEIDIEVIENGFDLTVEILSVKQPVIVGKTVEVQVRINNSGSSKAEKVQLKLSDGKKPLKYFTVRRVKAKSSKTLKLDIIPLSAPQFILHAEVDPANLIKENNENNNKDSRAVASQAVKGIDLLPGNIVIEEAIGMPRGTYIISYLIRNTGVETSSGFQCDVSVNAGEKGKYRFIFADEADKLQPGKSLKFERKVFIDDVPSRLKVQVEVDSLEAIHETNENNNLIIMQK